MPASHRLTLTLLPAFLAMACSQAPEEVVAPSSQVTQLDLPAPATRDRYIVMFRRDVMDVNSTVTRLAQAHGIGQVHYEYTALKGFAATLSGRALEALRRSPEVARIEEDQLVSITGSQLPAPWGLDRIDQRGRSLNGLYGYTSTGKGVTVYVVDTGILPTHAEFGSRASVGFDAFADGQKGIDCNGHGTHVAGTVGGQTYGVAKEVTLIGVRVLNCSGSGTISSVLAGLDWVQSHQAAQPAPAPAVVNLSLGGYLAETTLDDAVSLGVSQGITHVMAAGNGNTTACSFTPARATSGLTVGATESNDYRAYFSNYGSCVDLFAPGVGILSAYIGSNTAAVYLDGTSMAAPHVTGAAALYLETTPAAAPAAVATALSAIATPNAVSDPGEGSPNLLLFAVTGALPSAPPAPASLTATATSTSSIALSWPTVAGADSYQLERVNSVGGSSFSTLGVGTTSTLVTGLAAGTTYTFKLRAYNAGGISEAQTASATTQGPALTSVRVGGLSAMTVIVKSNWQAKVTITVTTATGSAPVQGATASGRFGSAGVQTCVTGSNGTCQITSGNFSKKVASTTFTVTSIAGTGLTYASGSNTVSSLTINRP